MSKGGGGLVVRVGGGEYARKWRFLGGEENEYEMTADRSRVVFSPRFGEGNAEDIVVGRGLIKWYCSSCNDNNDGAKAKNKKKGKSKFSCPPEKGGKAESKLVLEISPDCALGAGEIEVYCLEEKVDLLKWINGRFFPSKGEELLGGLSRCFSLAWRRVKAFFSAMVPTFCKSNEQATSSEKRMTMMSIVERRGSSVASSAMSSIRLRRRRSSQPNPAKPTPPPPEVQVSTEDQQSFASNDPDEAKRHLRKQAYSLDLSGEDLNSAENRGSSADNDSLPPSDPLSRTQSLNVRFRRKESVKRIKRGVAKVWKSLSYNSRLQVPSGENPELHTYSSFEKIDDDFNFDDDGYKFCDDEEVHHAHDNVAKQTASVKRKQFREAASPSDNVGNSRIDRIFDRRRLSSYLEVQADSVGAVDGVAIFGDEGFDTLCEDDDEDDAFSETAAPNEISNAATKAFYERRKASPVPPSMTSNVVPVAFDESDGTVIVVDSMDIYKVPKDSVVEGNGDRKGKSPSPTSDEFDKCDASSSSASSSADGFARVKSGTTRRYVDQSASLVSLRSSAAVSSAVARFDALSTSPPAADGKK